MLRNAAASIARRAAGAAFCLLLVVAPLEAGAVEIQTVTGEKSGVTAWLVEDYSVPVISVAMAFEGGSTQDPVGKEGMANLLSTLFDEGAGPLDSDAFQAKVEQLGVTLRFSDGRDAFSGLMRTLREDRDEAAELLRLSLTELRFEEASIERMREALKSQIRRNANDPQTRAGEAMRNSLFGGHPYSRPTSGTVEGLDAITREDIVAHFRRLFARDNLTVAIVGAISPQEAAQMVDRVFAGLPANAQLEEVPDAELRLGERIEVDSTAPQTSIILALPGVPRDSPEFFAAYLANHILGGGSFSSRLYDEVREKRGLAYSVGTGLTNLEHAAYLTASASTRADRANETLEIMREEIRRLAEEGPSEAELQAAKDYVIGSYAISFLDTSSKIARALVTIQTENLGMDYIDRRAQIIGAVTMEEVRAAARRLLGAEPTVVVVGPSNS